MAQEDFILSGNLGSTKRYHYGAMSEYFMPELTRSMAASQIQ